MVRVRERVEPDLEKTAAYREKRRAYRKVAQALEPGLGVPVMDGYTLGLYEKSMPGACPSPKSWRLRVRPVTTASKSASMRRMRSSPGWTGAKRSGCASWRAPPGAGCPVATMCLSAHRRYPLGSEDPETAGRGMEIFEGAVLLAEAVGVRLIQLAGYDEYYRESNARTRENFLRNLRRAVHFAAAHKVQLGFETMETPFMDTCEKAMRYVAQIGSPYLSVYPDIGNMTNAAKLYRTDVLDDLASAGGHIAAMHLKETRPGRLPRGPLRDRARGFPRRGAKGARSRGARLYGRILVYGGTGVEGPASGKQPVPAPPV